MYLTDVYRESDSRPVHRTRDVLHVITLCLGIDTHTESVVKYVRIIIEIAEYRVMSESRGLLKLARWPSAITDRIAS